MRKRKREMLYMPIAIYMCVYIVYQLICIYSTVFCTNMITAILHLSNIGICCLL